jgi:hypothetical protein
LTVGVPLGSSSLFGVGAINVLPGGSAWLTGTGSRY